MVYDIYHTPRFSLETPRPSISTRNSAKTTKSRRSAAEDYWTSPSTFFGYGGLEAAAPRSKNSPAASIRHAVDNMTEDYWSTPSPLNPTPVFKSAKSSAAASAATSAAPSIAPKKEKKNLMSKIKNAVNKGTDEYWANKRSAAPFQTFVAHY